MTSQLERNEAQRVADQQAKQAAMFAAVLPILTDVAFEYVQKRGINASDIDTCRSVEANANSINLQANDPMRNCDNPFA